MRMDAIAMEKLYLAEKAKIAVFQEVVDEQAAEILRLKALLDAANIAY